jgi:hypothetical protein
MSAHDTQNDHPSGYEKQDTSIRAVLITTLVTLAVITIAVVALWDYYIATREAVIFEQSLAPESEQLIQLQKLEDSLLTTYEFVDSTSGVYRIPIERAMELLTDEASGTARR